MIAENIALRLIALKTEWTQSYIDFAFQGIKIVTTSQ
jgi:hypothetical protein